MTDLEYPSSVDVSPRPESDLTFIIGDGGDEPVLTLTHDRRVIWRGEQTDAALAFWRIVEQAWPRFICETARK